MENDLKRIFAENLRKYMKRDDRSQVDIANLLKVSPSTASEWINAKKYPRMDKVQILADYFGINLSDLVEESLLTEVVSNDEMEIISLYKNATVRAKELARMALVAGQIEKEN